MGTLFSGVGLVSGLDIQGLVDKLIAIESRPRDILIGRKKGLDAKRTIYMDISARVSAITARINALATVSAFKTNKVSSSDPTVLAATVNSAAAAGSYNFVVKSLASTQQVLSQGFASAGAALGGGTLTIEPAAARVDAQTKLNELNGFAGVRRGSFKIIAGTQEAKIDISDAVTVQDVLDRINAAGIGVKASIDGDRLLLETPGGAIQVKELDGGSAAADLGFGLGSTYNASGKLAGKDVVFASAATPLKALNDGAGVRRAIAGGDFTINGMTVDLSTILKDATRVARLNHGGGANLGKVKLTYVDAKNETVTKEVDLTGLKTVGELKTALETAAPELSLTLTSSKLVLSYKDGKTEKQLKVEDLTGTGAKDLGLLGDVKTGKITSHALLVVDQLSDIVAAINYAETNAGDIVAKIVDDHLVIEGGGSVSLAAVGTSKALEDLGFEAKTYSGPAAGARLLGGLDTVLLRTLNGGKGFVPGVVQLSAGATSATIDLSGAATLAEVVSKLRSGASAAGMTLDIGYDGTGTKLTINHVDGVTPVTLGDLTGTFAKDTGLAGSGPVLKSANLQRRYISEATLLSDLNGGRGVSAGKIKVIDSSGAAVSVDLNDTSVKTIGDVIDRINASGAKVKARLNDTGDGILIEDAAGGSGALKVEEDGGTTARDLNLLGEGTGGKLDGSFEQKITIGSGQTLQQLLDQVNKKSTLAKASLLNDGGGVNAFRLNLTSLTQGAAGELIFDGDALGLSFTTLNKAQDAKVLLGGGSGGVLLTSSSNTITGAMPGLNLTLNGTSEKPVVVNVAEDKEALLGNVNGLVETLNAALDRLNEVSKYDPETQTAGPLLGESEVNLVRGRLIRLITAKIPGMTGSIKRLSDLGFGVKEGRITFNEEKFREKLETDPSAVTAFFTTEETGAAAWMKDEIEFLIGEKGPLERRESAYESQAEDLSKRVAQLNELLDLKRARLMRQFLAMEQSLAQLQSQQNSLGAMTSLVSTMGSGAKK